MIEAPLVITVLATFAVVVGCIMLHYETLVLLSRYMNKTTLSHRHRILLLVFSLQVLHAVEIFIFGLVGWVLVVHLQAGSIYTLMETNLLEFMYLSSVTYTTLGYGDIFPQGSIRLFYGSEALTGFALITWSASFTFIEMQQHWSARKL